MIVELRKIFAVNAEKVKMHRSSMRIDDCLQRDKNVFAFIDDLYQLLKKNVNKLNSKSMSNYFEKDNDVILRILIYEKKKISRSFFFIYR